MPSKSKSKGNANEHVVADILSAWWQQSFNRMPTSGALRWNNNVFIYGDLLPPENFPGIIECKHYKYIELDAVMHGEGPKSYILGWWIDQVIPDVERCYKNTKKKLVPLLVWKMNNRHHRMMLWTSFLERCVGYEKLVTLRLQIPGWDSLSIVDLNAFVKAVSKDAFMAAFKSTESV